MPQLAWFMVAFSGIAFVLGIGRAAAEFGSVGVIDFLWLTATPSLIAVVLWWVSPRFHVPRSVVVTSARIILVATCALVFLGALLGVGAFVRRG